ncbi:deoxyguanosinetriphosphate triphosphohydrolase [Piscinibacterium candidicorallinum]|uniref:Deoxyguanosinetriphosphate triphosphohydrolase-like protein n=1 Tax=Piscinibacterium candidicorallinum TaxID=1793872 RepID=A0ABV7H4X4_9BURK
MSAVVPLAPYAARSAESRGRIHAEADDPNRPAFQRDRDRIVHCTAFRRLEYKTQVFLNHEGDLFRTRLTHSIEVAQIGRSLARRLRLNEDLVEAISLAHDLGHTPFGHAGQDALNSCMKEHGGFEHNLQSLRVVDVLEERYAAFDGLNLTYETREGILKHCSRRNAEQLGELGRRFINGGSPSLEAQVANLADEIAYNNHDIDDGLRSGYINLDDLAEVKLWEQHAGAVREQFPGCTGRRLISETIRRMISAQVDDLTQSTSVAIESAGVSHVDQVRALSKPLVQFSVPMREDLTQLKQFLFNRLYKHYLVQRMTDKARRIVTQLFEAFANEPLLLPPAYQSADRAAQYRSIADYVAGMTDRYAMREFRKIFSASELELR